MISIYLCKMPDRVIGVEYIEDIKIFGMNMSFISSSEAKKNAYFMSGEATNEIIIFSLHRMK